MRRSRTLASAPAAVALAAVALAAMPFRPAGAHAILMDSDPAIGASLPDAGPLALRLRFNSRVDAQRSRLRLTSPGGVATVLPITPGPTADLLLGSAKLPPGAYVLHWQVLAVDGHITRGEIPFILTGGH